MIRPMMRCGHAANSVCRASCGAKFDPPIPSCAICNPPDSLTIDESPTDISLRTARCFNFGKKPSRNDECNYGRRGAKTCPCERPSSTELPFFEHCPGKPFDSFYCGCMSWD